jgi:hypothetical protein
MKKQLEVRACDYPNYSKAQGRLDYSEIATCKACGRDFCQEHAPNEDWAMPDMCLCVECNDEAYNAAVAAVKEIKKKKVEV